MNIDIRLHELAEVSNNSHLTNMVMNAINEKFDDNQVRQFREWLRLVKDNTQQQITGRNKSGYRF